jgi:error-prone DNA polymerase
MRSLGFNRHEALWQVLALGEDPPLLEGHEPQEEPTHLPDLSLKESVYADYRRIGLSLAAHPMSLIRDRLRGMNILPSRALKHARQGQWIRVAGLVLIRQRPSTALGIIFCTLEDETGVANLVIRPPIYQKYRCAARGAVALIAEGRIERQNEVVHLQCTRLQDLSTALPDLASTSRDFR